MRKAPTLRWNNGSIQLRLRINGVDHRIHRLGSWSDPTAVARAQALSAQIWSDWCSGQLDPTLERYQTKRFQQQQKQSLVEMLKQVSEQKPQARIVHTYRLVLAYDKEISTQDDVKRFVEWMQKRGLAASTMQSVLSTIRSVHPHGEFVHSVQVKVPERSALEEVLSQGEIQSILEDLQKHETWYYAIFAVWLGTGLRNSELIGLTWDCVRFEQGELLIVKSLRRISSGSHQRQWGSTKTGRSRVVPMSPAVHKVLLEHREQMQQHGLETDRGLVFVTPRTHGHLYDSGLERVWKRSQRRVGLNPRRLYAQRHSFLSHALAMGNSPADLAAVAGHRTEELLKTYAKPTGRIQLPCWSDT